MGETHAHIRTFSLLVLSVDIVACCLLVADVLNWLVCGGCSSLRILKMDAQSEGPEPVPRKGTGQTGPLPERKQRDLGFWDPGYNATAWLIGWWTQMTGSDSPRGVGML